MFSTDRVCKHRGGIAQVNTLICDIKDLSVDTEIYASGELVLVDLEPVPEEYTDSPTQGITLGVLKLLKRR